MPLVVSVMATSAEGFSRLVSGVAEREEVAALELNVSCPNVHSGLIVGEQPRETAKPAGGSAAADREAADRQADPERRRSGGGRGRRRGRRRRLGLPDQHPEGDRDRSADAASPGSAPAAAGSPAPRCGRWRWSRSGAVSDAVAIPVIGMGGVCCGADALEMARRRSHPGGGRNRELPRPRRPARGCSRSCPGARAERSFTPGPEAELEVQVNLRENRVITLARA